MEILAYFTELLKNSYEEKKSKNPRLSLRRYASLLGLSPSFLSEIFSGKSQISIRKMNVLLESKHLNRELVLRFQNFFPATFRPKKYSILKEDTYELISSWIYFALLSLFETKEFTLQPSWIAKRLNISERQVHKALHLLVKLGLLKHDENFNLAPSQESFASSDEVSSKAVQKAHQDSLRLAEKKLQTVDVEFRDFTGITMAIDPRKIPEAKQKIRIFRDELCSFLESGEKTEVFRLCIQLFPLTQPSRD